MSWRVGDENVMMCFGGKVANVTTYIIVYCSGERLFSFWINKESWDVFALYFLSITRAVLENLGRGFLCS
jgi:hypothetical protein